MMFKSYALSLKQELNLGTEITVFLDRDQEPRQSKGREKCGITVSTKFPQMKM